MSTGVERRHGIVHPPPAAGGPGGAGSSSGAGVGAAPVSGTEQYRQSVEQTGREVLHSAEQTAEQLKHKAEEAAHMAKEKAEELAVKAKEKVKSGWRKASDEVKGFIHKLKTTTPTHYAIHLASTLLVTIAMHSVLNFFVQRLPWTMYLTQLYLKHYQPWAFVIGMAVASLAINHIDFFHQYAWSVLGLNFVAAMLPILPIGVLQKTAVSVPLSAFNILWVAAVPVASNWLANKIRIWSRSVGSGTSTSTSTSTGHGTAA